MVLSIRPVFVGGPLHGEPVDFLMVELGRDVMVMDFPDADPRTILDFPDVRQVRYTPLKFNLINDQRDVSGELQIRDVFQIMVWVDSRLCEEARNRRMWEIIRANGWETAVALCLGWSGSVNRATSSAEEVVTDGQSEEPAPEQPER